MGETDPGETDALARLEAALDRIARHQQAAPNPVAAVDTAQITARLDRLIGHIGHALATEG